MRGKKLNLLSAKAIIFHSETMYENRENRREGASKEQDCNLEVQLRRSGRFARGGKNIPPYVGGSPADRIGGLE